MTEPLRVAMVMPPVVAGDPRDAIARWTTLTRTMAELHAVTDVAIHVVGRHESATHHWTHGPDSWSFVQSDRKLATAIASARPHVVHVHGLTHARQWLRVSRAGFRRLPPTVMQHHGEPVPATHTRATCSPVRITARHNRSSTRA